MNKKAQATSWSLKEIFTLFLRIMAVIVLVAFIAGIVSIFTKPKMLGNAYQDLERVAGEIQDLEEGESIIVPTLSVGYSVMIRTSEVAESLRLPCKTKEADYCACLLDKDENILTCKEIVTEADISNIDFNLRSGETIVVEHTNDRITIGRA